MNSEERFIEKCSRMNFDRQGFSQTRVWTRVTAPRRPLWRRWAAVSACAVFLFAAGFVCSRWVSGPVNGVPAHNQPCAPSDDPYLLLCVKGNGRSAGYCCKRHSFYGDDALPAQFAFPALRECMHRTHPDLPSFYNFRENC